MNINTRVNRIEIPEHAEMVARLIRTAPVGEMDFTAGDFLAWVEKSLPNENILVAAFLWEHRPVGFVIAFGPWEMDRRVWVFQAFCCKPYRATPLVRDGIEYVQAWARECGATGVAFQTTRPRAWSKLMPGNRKAVYIVEV